MYNYIVKKEKSEIFSHKEEFKIMNLTELVELTIKILKDYKENAQGLKDSYTNLTTPMVIGVWEDYLRNLESQAPAANADAE